MCDQARSESIDLQDQATVEAVVADDQLVYFRKLYPQGTGGPNPLLRAIALWDPLHAYALADALVPLRA